MYTGENQVPDFNICDYAIGFHYIYFQDRYIRFPLYHFYQQDYELAMKKHEMSDKQFYIQCRGSAMNSASLIDQTYTNLEIILVDDGSPNKSGSICDNWATRDSRIRVFHKENGGLFDARNAGMAASSGVYYGTLLKKALPEVLYLAYFTIVVNLTKNSDKSQVHRHLGRSLCKNYARKLPGCYRFTGFLGR